MPIEIYFKDLKEEMQKALLEGLGITKPEEGNLDVFPLAVCHTLDDLEEDEREGLLAERASEEI